MINHDLMTIVTPINVQQLHELLDESHYDKGKTAFLMDGFTNGFDLEYAGPMNRQDRSKNIPLDPEVGNEVDLWNKVIKEVKLGQFAGPFKDIPFEHYVQSPIGLVPKAGGQQRLIFHLSFDFGPEDRQKSINHHTPEPLCSVKYNDLDDAILNSLHLLAECDSSVVYYAKTDVRSAFRIVPLKVKLFCLLVMMVRNPQTGEPEFFADKCLPFGASISCVLFQKVSDALKWITEYKIRQKKRITNYLDDFLFLAATARLCNQHVETFLQVCLEVNCPIVQDKMEWATLQIVFLGVLLDGERAMLIIPYDKKLKALNAVEWTLNKKKVTIKQIQCLTGLLNFLNKCIVPGRAFTR